MSDRKNVREMFESLFAPSLVPALCTDEQSLIEAAQRELDEIESRVSVDPSPGSSDPVA